MTVQGVSTSGGLKLDPLMVQKRVSFSGKEQHVLKMEGTALKVKERAKIFGMNWKVTTPWAEHIESINRAMISNPNKFHEWVKGAELTATESLEGVNNLYANLRDLSLRYLESLRKKVTENPKVWKENSPKLMIEKFREILDMKSTSTKSISDGAVIDAAFRNLHDQYHPQICSQLIEAMNKHRNPEKIPRISLISRYILDAQRMRTVHEIKNSGLYGDLAFSNMTKTLNQLDEAIQKKSSKEVLAGARVLGEFYNDARNNLATKTKAQKSVVYIHLGLCMKLFNRNAPYLKEVIGKDSAEYMIKAFRELRTLYGDAIRAW